MRMQQGLKMRLKTQQRMALFGRLRMADWIEMPEKEFAKEIAAIEKDPLFKKLFFGNERLRGTIRRSRWPGGKMSGSFYEVNEQLAAGGERVPVEEMVDKKTSVAGMIRRMGQEAFERCFLHAEEPLTLDEIARRTKTSPAEVQAIHEFLIEMGARAEFQPSERRPAMARSYSCLARLALEEGKPSFSFFSPYWARGLYQIRYDLLEDWKEKGDLAPEERRRLPRLLKRIETVNLRQNTLFRVLESVTQLQADYLKTQHEQAMRPISLRQLAHRLNLAPSTVSRALCGRSVQYPWGEEAPLIRLVPGRRHVLREILSEWLEQGARRTDAALTERLKEEYAIRVSRRTVNAVRNELRKRKK